MANIYRCKEGNAQRKINQTTRDSNVWKLAQLTLNWDNGGRGGGGGGSFTISQEGVSPKWAPVENALEEEKNVTDTNSQVVIVQESCSQSFQHK